MDVGTGSNPETSAATAEFDALIISAGFADLYQLHLLRGKLGLKVRVLEWPTGSEGSGIWIDIRVPAASELNHCCGKGVC